MRNAAALGPRVSQEHREAGTDDLVDTAGLSGWPAPPDVTPASPPVPTSACCLRCRGERAESPPPAVTDGQPPPMGSTLSPAGRERGAPRGGISLAL